MPHIARLHYCRRIHCRYRRPIAAAEGAIYWWKSNQRYRTASFTLRPPQAQLEVIRSVFYISLIEPAGMREAYDEHNRNARQWTILVTVTIGRRLQQHSMESERARERASARDAAIILYADIVVETRFNKTSVFFSSFRHNRIVKRALD